MMMRALHFADDPSEVGEKIGADFGGDQRPAPLGAEDQVDHDIAGRVCQALSPLTGLARSLL
ncbi:MAG: hypothetical protein WCC22_08545, partial [Terriglobales bacterium]